MSPNIAAACSMRVPTGGRTCSVIWPASTDGKKFDPRNGTSTNDASTTAEEADHERPAMGERHGEQVAIAARGSARTAPRSRAGSGQRSALPPPARPRSSLRMRLEQIHRHRRHQRARQDEGRDHREHHRFRHRHEQEAGDALAARTSARTRCRCTAARRRPAARSAARRRGSRCVTSLPCSRCQLMFSIVTVASSTRMPTASASPPSVMMFSVWPVDHRAPRARTGSRAGSRSR